MEEQKHTWTKVPDTLRAREKTSATVYPHASKQATTFAADRGDSSQGTAAFVFFYIVYKVRKLVSTFSNTGLLHIRLLHGWIWVGTTAVNSKLQRTFKLVPQCGMHNMQGCQGEVHIFHLRLISVMSLLLRASSLSSAVVDAMRFHSHSFGTQITLKSSSWNGQKWGFLR